MEDNATFQAAIRYATGVYYPRIANAPLSAFVAARKVLSPGFFDKPLVPAPQHSVTKKPYRQRSLLTKQRTRLTRLRSRILRKSPLFFFEQFQEKLAANPEYYGVCTLMTFAASIPTQGC